MGQKFTITESERNQIRGLYEEKGYRNHINEQVKPVPQQSKKQNTSITLPLLKECAAAVAAGTPLYMSKVMPGYFIFSGNIKSAYKQVTLSNLQIRRSITLNAFQVKPGTVNVIYKDLVIGDESDVTNNGDVTWTNCPDISSFIQYLNKQAPRFPYMIFENDQFPSLDWWRLSYYISRVVPVQNMINILKQSDPNIGKTISDSFGMSQGLADENLRKQIDQVTGNQPSQGQQPVQGQPLPK
jgi:hypothetical protein